MKDSSPNYRGSRKHMLDWLDSDRFQTEFGDMLAPLSIRLVRWWPEGREAPEEARLEQLGELEAELPGFDVEALSSWWLAHPRGANTPNWDLLALVEIEGRAGLVLVEAKANLPELSHAGKRPPNVDSEGSKANDARIGLAIREAGEALGVGISKDRSYQLSNRIAFAWKLASMGVPVALVYLGFVGDRGIRDVGPPLESTKHWRELVREYLTSVEAMDLFEEQVDCGPAGFWFLVRARDVLEPSNPRGE